MNLPVLSLLQCLVSWGGVGPSAPMAPPTATTAVPSLAGIVGAGGRLSWEAETRSDPTLHLDAQLVVRPVPRVFFTGAWGSVERSRTGGGQPDTTVTQTRWELGAAVVAVQGAGSGYIPVVWRSVRERDDRLGDASWTSWGFGLGGLMPISHPIWMRAEGLWVMDEAHEDPAWGPGRQTERSGLELGLGFLVFLW